MKNKKGRPTAIIADESAEKGVLAAEEVAFGRQSIADEEVGYLSKKDGFAPECPSEKDNGESIP